MCIRDREPAHLVAGGKIAVLLGNAAIRPREAMDGVEVLGHVPPLTLPAITRHLGASFAVGHTRLMAIIWAPTVLDRFEIKGRGTVFVVEADREFSREHPECVGWTLVAAEKLWDILAVERHALSGAIKPGEAIGLLVRESA